jgi:hypothetical protein
MAHKAKSGGFTGNLAKIGGAKRKLSLKSDFRGDSAVNSTFKKASKQAHKKA